MIPALVGALPGIISAAGGIAGMFGKKGRNPSDAANDYLNQIPGAVGKYYQPYIDAGRGALDSVTGEYGTAVNDPNSIYNKLASGYKESPGYKFRLQQALGGAANASAAGGMLGTPQDQQQQSQVASDIASQDFEKYLQNMFGIYNQGLSGEQHISDQGYDASSSMGNVTGSVLGQQAQNAFTGQQGKNQANQGNWANIISGISGAAQGWNQGNQQQALLDWLKSNGGY